MRNLVVADCVSFARRSTLRTARKRRGLMPPPLPRLCSVSPPLHPRPAPLGPRMVFVSKQTPSLTHSVAPPLRVRSCDRTRFFFCSARLGNGIGYRLCRFLICAPCLLLSIRGSLRWARGWFVLPAHGFCPPCRARGWGALLRSERERTSCSIIFHKKTENPLPFFIYI